MATRPEDLADAYEAVAKANHYMVGIVGTDTAPITDADRERASAILIDRENAAEGHVADAERRRFVVSRHVLARRVTKRNIVKRALDLLEHDQRQATLRASRGGAADPAPDILAGLTEEWLSERGAR